MNYTTTVKSTGRKMTEQERDTLTAHDRTLVALDIKIGQLVTDTKDIKAMLEVSSNKRELDANSVSVKLSEHEKWVQNEVRSITVEVAVLKTKIVIFSMMGGFVASAAISIVMKIL